MKIYRANVIPPTVATDAELQDVYNILAPKDSVVPLPSLGLTGVPPGVTITATSEYPGYSAQNVYRQLNGTELWYTLVQPTPQSPQTLTIEFAEPQTIDGYHLFRVNQAGSTPFTWEVETREDGVWVQRDRQENLPWSAISDYRWGRLKKSQDGIRLRLLNTESTIAGVWRFYPIQLENSLTEYPANDIFTQTNHGFIKGDIVRATPAGWVKSQREVSTGWGRQMVAQVFSVDKFRIAKEGTIYSDIPIINPVVGGYVYQGSVPGTLTCDTPNSGQTIIMGELLTSLQFLYAPESRKEASYRMFTYTQVAHGFTAPSVVAWSGSAWVVADKDTAIDVFLVISTTTDSFTVGINGVHRVDHGLGNNPGLFYLGDNGQITRTPPAANQTPKGQLILGQVLDANHFWIQPEWRPI
jgi:hypothetical protein